MTEEPSLEAQPAPSPGHPARPWGLWATSGFIALTAVAFVVAQQGAATIYLAVLMAVRGADAVDAIAANVMSDGTLLALATLVSGIVCTSLVIVFAWLKRDLGVRGYLALHRVSPLSVAGWIGVLTLVIAATDLLTFALGRPVVPEFMVEAYRSCAFVPLLWTAIVIVGPLFEEVFVRGFIFAGLESSRAGGVGAVVITSLLWTVVHMQYDLYQLSIVFTMGLVLGIARLKSGSLVPCIVMHVFANLVATTETAVIVHLS